MYSLVELLESLNPPTSIPATKHGKWKGHVGTIQSSSGGKADAAAGNLDALISPRPKEKKFQNVLKPKKKKDKE